MDERTEAIFYATPDETNINLQIPGRITNPDIVEDNVNFDIELAVTAQFPLDSNVQHRKPGLQSKDKETVK